MAGGRGRTKAPPERGRDGPWRIAAYIRLSREDGNDESLSVANQRKIILEFVGQYFAGQDCALVSDYVDDGLSGTTEEARPAFQRMVCDIASGKVNCVICKTLSRAFRNYADQGRFLEQFIPAHGCRFISIGGPFVDTYADPGCTQNLEIPISGLMNDRYAARTSADVRRTFDTKRRRGEFIGAFAPYGYRKDPENRNRLLVDEEAAQVVRDMFRWFVAGGMSRRGIARRLNDLGVPNPSAYKRAKGFPFHTPHTDSNDGLWSPTSVSRILRDPLYAGVLRQGRQKVVSYKVHTRVSVPEEAWFLAEGAAPAVVDRALFQAAQELGRRNTRTAPGRSGPHLFAGLVRCAGCGKGMHRRSSKGYSYYVCRSSAEKSLAACTRRSIREDVLEGAVLAAIQQQVALVPSLPELAEEIRRAPAATAAAARLETLLKARGRDLDRVTARLDGLYEDWKNGDLSREQYRRMRAKYEEQARSCREQLRRMEGERRSLAESAAEEPGLAAFLRHGNIQSLTRGLLTELVDVIYVHEDGSLAIHFRFADPLRQSPAPGDCPPGGHQEGEGRNGLTDDFSASPKR